MGQRPRGQDDGAGLDRLFPQTHNPRLDGLHRRAGPDLYPRPRTQHADGVVGQHWDDLGQDAVPGFEQDEAGFIPPDPRVIPGDRVHESGQLTEQLDADQASADDHEREVPPPPNGVGLRIGPLEPFDQVIAKHERVGQGLEGERVGRPGNLMAVGYGAEGQDELVVRQLELSAFGSDGVDHAPVQVDMPDGGLDEADATQEGTDRDGAVAEVQDAGAGLK